MPCSSAATAVGTSVTRRSYPPAERGNGVRWLSGPDGPAARRPLAPPAAGQQLLGCLVLGGRVRLAGQAAEAEAVPGRGREMRGPVVPVPAVAGVVVAGLASPESLPHVAGRRRSDRSGANHRAVTESGNSGVRMG